ncbi:hypothetical protein BDV95DRAFT_602205 [Massariosphaeria phaeospora]|uniref:Uncharacterized protein n=1 Tax=Massariosphaeria phaeospora TaxID=100035 RepID=A0A7C8IFW7_9PLEO|nr:hypothetical protein BDV95DRAFT_602205 [Massariosphaeria phaeospora]
MPLKDRASNRKGRESVLFTDVVLLHRGGHSYNETDVVDSLTIARRISSRSMFTCSIEFDNLPMSSDPAEIRAQVEFYFSLQFTCSIEFDNLPISSDPAEIRAQVEFYFSPQNLRGEQHLFHKIEGPRNIPVSIKHAKSPCTI